MKHRLKRIFTLTAAVALFAVMFSTSVAAQAPAPQHFEPLVEDYEEVIFTVKNNSRECSVYGTKDMELGALARAAALLTQDKVTSPRIIECCSVGTMRVQTLPYDIHFRGPGANCTVEYGNMVWCAYCGYVHSKTAQGAYRHMHY